VAVDDDTTTSSMAPRSLPAAEMLVCPVDAAVGGGSVAGGGS
jgi:hypothetical protein